MVTIPKEGFLLVSPTHIFLEKFERAICFRKSRPNDIQKTLEINWFGVVLYTYAKLNLEIIFSKYRLQKSP